MDFFGSSKIDLWCTLCLIERSGLILKLTATYSCFALMYLLGRGIPTCDDVISRFPFE